MTALADTGPWQPYEWDAIDWQSDPRAAYVKGLQDGYAMCEARAGELISDAVMRAFSADAATLGEAVDHHIRAIEREAYRRLQQAAAATREAVTTPWQSSDSTSAANASRYSGTPARPVISRRPRRSVAIALARASSPRPA